MNSCLKYHGGKSYLASRIVALMPDHIHYVEPYFGGGSVLFKKNPVNTSEVVNDIDLRLTNFWRVLQNPVSFGEFKRRMDAMPFSQREWVDAVSAVPSQYLDVDAAVNFFVRCRQSLSGRSASFAAISRSRLRRGMNEQCSAWMSTVEGLPLVHARLQRVFIYSDDAVAVIRRNDGCRTLFYLDPPYPDDAVATHNVYAHSMGVAQHVELLKAIQGLKGKVILSSYPNQLYDSALQGWQVKDFNLPNNASGEKLKRRMVERLYLNY